MQRNTATLLSVPVYSSALTAFLSSHSSICQLKHHQICLWRKVLSNHFWVFIQGSKLRNFTAPDFSGWPTQRAAEAATLDFKCIFGKDEFRKCQHVCNFVFMYVHILTTGCVCVRAGMFVGALTATWTWELFMVFLWRLHREPRIRLFIPVRHGALCHLSACGLSEMICCLHQHPKSNSFAGW